MWRFYQVQRLVAVSTILFAASLAEVAQAAPTPACNPTIVGPNGTCTSSTTVAKPATAAGGAPVTSTSQTTTTNTTTYGTTTWQGLNWGIGIAADFDLGGKRVTGAEIDTAPGGNIVRVTDTSGNVGVSLVLEAHYFFKEWLPFANCQDYNCNDIAIGPFVAIEAGNATTSGSNGPITGYALGAMVGLHHPDPTLIPVGISALGCASIPRLRYWVTVCERMRLPRRELQPPLNSLRRSRATGSCCSHRSAFERLGRVV